MLRSRLKNLKNNKNTDEKTVNSAELTVFGLSSQGNDEDYYLEVAIHLRERIFPDNICRGEKMVMECGYWRKYHFRS